MREKFRQTERDREGGREREREKLNSKTIFTDGNLGSEREREGQRETCSYVRQRQREGSFIGH